MDKVDFRAPADLVAWLDEEADDRNMSRSALLRQIVADYRERESNGVEERLDELEARVEALEERDG